MTAWTVSAPTPAGEPAWRQAQREAAAARFAEVGLPSTKLEAWKYTSTKKLGDVAFTGASRIDEAAAEALIAPLRLADADVEWVFVAGRYAARLSRSTEVAGLSVTRLGESAAALRDRLGGLAAWQAPDRAFAALNTALAEDGVVVQAASGTVAQVHVLVVGQALDGPTMSHLRQLVVAARGSELTLATTFVSAEGEAVLTSLVDEVYVEQGARVRQVATGVQPEGAHVVHTVDARLERDAHWHGHLSWLGRGWTRSDVDVVLAGEGAEAWLDGIYVVGGRSHVDNHTRLQHAAPHGTSRESYKGVLGGRAKGVFDGVIVVDEDAQRTDAQQSCRNLLVSRDADANAKPTLEIYADDVKCAHGTTVGQLDTDQLGYLRSRGIPLEQARRMLTAAFVADRVDRLPAGALRDRLQGLVDAALADVQEDG